MRSARAATWVGFLAAIAGLAPGASGQAAPLGDPIEAYQRILQLAGQWSLGSFTVRPASGGPSGHLPGAGHPWAMRSAGDPMPTGDGVSWAPGDSRFRVFANTRHPEGGNDGAVWQGRGLTTALETTSTLRWRGLSVVVNPLVLFNQNTAFRLAAPASPALPVVAYPWRVIDYPQRFGTESFWTFDWGQSEIAVDWGPARLSAGNANMWWGPGIENAIVMSANAPGFLHGSLASNRPIDVGIGELEGQWVWGGLGQSDWFDPALADVDRFFTGLVLTYSPSFIPGLAIGGTRAFQLLVPSDGIDTVEYLLVLQGLLKAGQVSGQEPDGTDRRDQILSIFARWAFPESGFEAYVEWARNDHSWDVRDLLLEPEHSQAYTLGFQHLTSASAERMFVLRGELTHLEAPPTFQVRPRGVYYEHSVVTQGYTNEGQILGATAGPGGNTQYIGVDMYDRLGMARLFTRRRVKDNDAYWVWAAANGAGFEGHDVSFDFGGNVMLFAGPMDLGAGLTFTREYNRNFFQHRNNVNLSLSAHWRAGAR